MIKKLLSCVEEYKKTTALSMFLVIFESFIEILIPTLMAIIMCARHGIYLASESLVTGSYRQV